MKLYLVFLLLFVGTSSQAQSVYKLTVRVTGITEPGHKLYYAVYNKAENFPNTKGTYANGIVLAKGAELNLALSYPRGTYAIALFYDENDNGKMDKGSLIPIPKEPYGFSNNPRITGKPKFASCSFSHTKDQQIVINLKD